MSANITIIWVCVYTVTFLAASAISQQGEGGFVEKLGEELWQLGQLVTKYSEITTKYRQRNARVDTNDGRNLTGQIVENVGRLLERRTNAVKCIQEKAEALIAESNRSLYGFRENYTLEYFNMRWSGVPRRKLVDFFADIDENKTDYISITLTPDRGFYSIPVNKNESAVHIPTNLYDRYPEVAESIFWSAGLNETFVSNYRADPEIGWQYYGASTGMMRQYPAMMLKREEEVKVDMFDCRTRPWYIEAATCGKDAVILMDTSGSMTGMRSTIAKLVVNKLLTTFGNNDYINVLNFSHTAAPVVKCFQSLVQANGQNVRHLWEAVNRTSPLGNASMPDAFRIAFEMLKEGRGERACNESCECQQAIFFITDGLPGSMSHVFDKYNRLEDGTVPVRVFTYLIGLEVRGVMEIKDIACQNRGMYTHITSMDQVQDEVLKYVNVMARPLALQQVEHTPRWTHLFADIDDPRLSTWLVDAGANPNHKRYVKSQFYSQIRDDEQFVTQVNQIEGEDRETTYKEYRMMTSVAIPVFDTREQTLNQSEELLAGVAGTDIPVHDIYQLTYPYKIGANGYAFIITNNGHLLMHPDHRPVFQGVLKENYNSVDFLDVEFAQTEEGDAILKTIRDSMIDLDDGLQNISVKVKFHYDNLRRVGVERRDYYFSHLAGTPFSLGLSIPSDYGNYQIGVKDVINEKFLISPTESNVFEELFRDPEWKLHPYWEYCQYIHASYKQFESKEEELKHILYKIKNQLDWRQWQRQWKAEREQQGEASADESCDRKSVEDDTHYCDPDLIKLLMFDAAVTLQSFQEPLKPRNSYELKLLKTFNATLRFVATQSGLTRWKKIPQPEGDDDRGNFGNDFPHAIDEPWFKAAVLQYNLDTKGEYNKDGDSFVFSVPFESGAREDLSVMATIAIFPRDGGRKAPASVVGYQLTYDSFHHRAMDLAENFSVHCNSTDLACYMIDHNAYIVLSSQSRLDVGTGLLNVRADVMVKLLQINMYLAIDIVDHQAITITRDFVFAKGAASILQAPWALAIKAFSWLWTYLTFTVFQQFGLAFHTHAAVVEIEDDYGVSEEEDVEERPKFKEEEEEGQEENKKSQIAKNKTRILRTSAEPAVNRHTLYLLQQTPQFYMRPKNEPSGAQTTLISARRIEHTNLVLVVVDLLQKNSERSTGPTPENATVCARYNRVRALHRRRLANCTSYHPREEDIEACGFGAIVKPSFIVVLMVMSLCFLAQHFHSPYRDNQLSS